jgi:phospholipid/cholesterol/gamma-HCH transport system ATP-binding protein
MVTPADTPPTAATPDAPDAPAIKVTDLVVRFGTKIVLDHLNLEVRRGEVLGFVGGSGQGKSVLTRAILGLTRYSAGTIEVLGENVDQLNEVERHRLDRRLGVLFQHGALFSGLTVRQNVQVPMREHARLSPKLMDELTMVRLDMVGLPPDAADKYPAELSGGMIKRVALARALAMDPEIVFLDEPTSGLDPIGASEFDDLVLTLQKTLGITVFMVTHDLDSLAAICNRVAALADKKVIATGTVEELAEIDHPWLQAYFRGKRARRLIV